MTENWIIISFFWIGKILELGCYYLKNTKDQTFVKGIAVKSESVER